jgi:DNA-binding transcriptional ArsR family regulator
VLLPPIDGDRASLLALLADGAAWSTSAVALALGASQRTVQRALSELEEAGRVRSVGQARAQRWPDSRRNCYSLPRCRSRRLRCHGTASMCRKGSRP